MKSLNQLNRSSRHLAILVAFAALTCTIPSTCRAAGRDLVLQPTSGPLAHQTVYDNSYALLIGINIYPNFPADLNLHYAVSDAMALRDVLIRSYGFPASHIRMLLNGDATRDKIIGALADFADQDTYHKDDRILVYFSGHGQTVKLPGGGDEGFLIPTDAKVHLDNIDNAAPFLRTCIAMQEVWDYLQSTPAKHVLLIADACYSGLLTQTRSLGVASGALAAMASRRALQVMTAGGKGEPSEELDNLGHGAFTYKLVEELKARATTPGDVFTCTDLYAALQQSVSNLTDGAQNPQFGNYKTEGEFLFITTKPQPVPTATNVADDASAVAPAPPADNPPHHVSPARPPVMPRHQVASSPPKHANPEAMHELYLAIQNSGGPGSDPSTVENAVRQAQKALDDGADVNGIIAEENQTPLICSLSYECEPLVRFFIEHGANVNKADPTGMTPMKMSVELSGLAKDILVQAGAR